MFSCPQSKSLGTPQAYLAGRSNWVSLACVWKLQCTLSAAYDVAVLTHTPDTGCAQGINVMGGVQGTFQPSTME